MVSWLSVVDRRDHARIRLVAALQDDQIGELAGDIHRGGFDRTAHDIAASARIRQLRSPAWRCARSPGSCCFPRRSAIRDCERWPWPPARPPPAGRPNTAPASCRRRPGRPGSIVPRPTRSANWPRRRGLAELRDATGSRRCVEDSSWRCMSAAPGGSGPECRYAIGDPSVRRRQLAVGAEGQGSGSAAEIATGVPAVPPLISSPGIVTLIGPLVGAGLLKMHGQHVAGAQAVVDLDGVRMNSTWRRPRPRNSG